MLQLVLSSAAALQQPACIARAWHAAPRATALQMVADKFVKDVTADPNAEDWGEVDAWLEGKGKTKLRSDDDDFLDPPRKSWTATSSGRMHDHFFSNTFATWPELGVGCLR